MSTTKTKSQARYLFRTRPVDPVEAVKQRSEEIAVREKEIARLREEIHYYRTQPLPAEIQEYVEVYPGDPGYESASEAFDPSHYQGNWEWVQESKGKE